MVIHKKEKKYKHALALQRESNKIHQHMRAIKPIKLDVPIQHGYVRSLEFRDDVKYRKDYLMLKKAFNLLGQRKVYNKKIDFIVNNGKHMHELHASIKTITDPRFNFYYSEESRQRDLAKIEETKRYLIRHDTIYSCDCPEHQLNQYKKTFIPHYTFRFPWMLQEITKPHFFTHYTPVYGELESRLEKIHQEMYNNNYYTLLYGRYQDRDYLADWTAIKYDTNKNVIYHALLENEDI